MIILGGILFAFGILSFLGAQLQHTDFFILLPSYILMAVGALLLILGEWRLNKHAEKKISMFALLCFILGFLGLLLQGGSKWLFFALSVMSIGCGIAFLIKHNKLQNILIGKTLSITGIIMAAIIFLASLVSIIFNIHQEKPEGLNIESRVNFLRNGKDIIFGAVINGKQQIFKFNPETKSTQQLTGIGTNMDPAISPLDDHIAFISDRNGNKELYLISADGTNERRLTNSRGENSSPSFSPDGTKIVIQRVTNWPRMRRIYVMEVNSGKEYQIMAYPYTQFYQDPIFMDNNTIRFESAGWICLIDVSLKKEISRTKKTEPSYYPIFSPDRRKVAFANFTGEYYEKGGAVYEIFVADSDGKNRKQITHNKACNRPKVFSPNGAYVVFLSGNPFDWGNLSLWQVNVDGTNPRQFDVSLNKDNAGITKENFEKELEEKFETSRFWTYSTKSNSDYARKVGRFCEEFLDRLKSDFNMDIDFNYPIKLAIFPDKASFEKYKSKRMEDLEGAYGVYYSEINSILTYEGSGWGTLTHEIIHPILDRNYPNIFPLDEIVTTFFEKFYGYWDKDGRLVIFWGFQNPWRIEKIEGQLLNIKLKDVLFGGQNSQHHYRLLSVFLFKNGKLPLFLELVKKNDKKGYPTFVEAAFVKSCGELEIMWSDYLKGIYNNREKIYRQPPSTIYNSKEEFELAGVPEFLI